MSKEVQRYTFVCDIENEEYVLASDYESLLAERDALKKDAERYRFLMRELGGSVSQVVMGSPTFSDEDVNAAIDASLQGAQP